jgi:hypothetical protein
LDDIATPALFHAQPATTEDMQHRLIFSEHIGLKAHQAKLSDDADKMR